MKFGLKKKILKLVKFVKFKKKIVVFIKVIFFKSFLLTMSITSRVHHSQSSQILENLSWWNITENITQFKEYKRI